MRGTVFERFFALAIDFIAHRRWPVLPSQRAHLFQDNVYRL